MRSNHSTPVAKILRRRRDPCQTDDHPRPLNLKILQQHSPLSDPMGKDFNYAKEFKSLDLAAVKKDLLALMSNGGDLTGLSAR